MLHLENSLSVLKTYFTTWHQWGCRLLESSDTINSTRGCNANAILKLSQQKILEQVQDKFRQARARLRQLRQPLSDRLPYLATETGRA